jgi:hypothetical protein
MIKKSKTAAIVAGTLAGSVLLAGTSFAALEGEGKRGKFLTDELKSALEAKDYDAFVEALPEGKTFSEENFDLKAELYEAKQDGDDERVTELKVEMKAKREAQKEAIKQAVSGGDYGEFISLLEGRGENITEDHFEIIQEIHEAKEAGDIETVKELGQELKEGGIKFPGKKGKKGQKGSKR